MGNALCLMDNAHAILNQSLSTARAHQAVPTNHSIRDYVTTFCSRKALVMEALVKPISLNWTTKADQDSPTPSMKLYLTVLKDKKIELDDLMYQAYEVVRVTNLLSHDEYEMNKLRPRQQSLLIDLHQWKEEILRICSNEQDPDICCLLSTLLMYWGMCYVWLSASVGPSETSYDQHTDEFQAIVDNARVILQLNAVPGPGGTVTTGDFDTIPALYFVSTKCRDPSVRREALCLLRLVPKREGLWGSIAAPRVVEKMIAFEEGSEHFSEHPGSLNTTSLPPEAQRIHHVAIVRGDVTGDRRYIKVQLSRPVLEADGVLKMVHEDLWVEDHTEKPPTSTVT